MAFVLKLSDSNDVIDFISMDFLLSDGGLQVGVPEARDVWGGGSVNAHGEQLIQSSFANREVVIKFDVHGASRDALIANVARIDRIIENARRRSIDETGTRVELTYAWDGTTNQTYFEVITGTLEWPDDVMSVEQVHFKDADGRYCITDFTLTLITYPFAYPASPVNGQPVAVDLLNANGTGSSVVVHNSNDVDHCNYIEVAAADLVGAYPLMTKLKLVGNSGEAEKIGTVYIGIRTGDFNFRHILEDDDAAERIGDATPVADPDFSSGDTHTVLTYTVNNPGSDPPIEPVTLAKWDLTPAEIDASQGAFRLFGKVRDTTFWDQNCNYAIAVGFGSTILHQTEWRSPLDTTISLFDFGTVFLPPWSGGVSGLSGMFIKLLARRKTYGTTTIDLDFVMLLPQDGGYRVLKYRGEGLGELEGVVDDGWERTTYHLTAAGKKAGIVFGMMNPLEIRANRSHRLYFLIQGLNGSSEVGRRVLASLSVVPTYMVLS